MIRTLRAYFLSRSLQEKILLLAFILIGTLWWLSAVGSRTARFWREQRATSSELAIQQQWLDKRRIIEEEARRAASRLEAAQTLDRARLISAVNQAASEVGLKGGSAANPSSDTNGQFTVHSIDFQAAGADYEALLKFQLKLNERAPYMAIERFLLYPTNSNDWAKLTLNLRVSSVEIPR